MEEYRTFIGIDNGISGGIACYKPGTNNLVVVPMPIIRTQLKNKKGLKSEYDIPAVIGLLKQFGRVNITILEKAQPFPGQGVVSQFSIGRSFGIMEGVLAALHLPYQIIHPKTWQKKMFEGIAHDDTKQASILVAKRLFPDVIFRASDKAFKDHNGMTDAALMAYYGYLIANK